MNNPPKNPSDEEERLAPSRCNLTMSRRYGQLGRVNLIQSVSKKLISIQFMSVFTTYS